MSIHTCISIYPKCICYFRFWVEDYLKLINTLSLSFDLLPTNLVCLHLNIQVSSAFLSTCLKLIWLKTFAIQVTTVNILMEETEKGTLNVIFDFHSTYIVISSIHTLCYFVCFCDDGAGIRNYAPLFFTRQWETFRAVPKETQILT